MSATFPYQCDWAPSPTMEPARLKVAFGDGYEQRASAGLNPFLASYDLAFSVRSEAEANAICAWLQSNSAHVDPFYWDPEWISTAANGEQFGTGDGVRSQWRLSKSGIYVSRDISLTYITREDWQGVVDLSPMSRTNILTYTEGSTTPWMIRGATAKSAASEARPDGSTGQVVTLAGIGLAGVDDAYTMKTSGCVQGARYEPTFWVKVVSGTGPLVLREPTGGAGAGGWWLIDTAILSAGWNRISRSHPAVAISSEFVSGANHGMGIWFAALAGSGPFTLKVIWQQIEQGTYPGGYISNPSSILNSLTDYTHASGQITLGQVPVEGAVLRWGGSGKTHLRWVADKWTPPEPVSFNNWRVQATFRQVP